VKRLLTDTIYRYAYLPIISAWLYTFSFIFSNYISYSTSPAGVQRTLQQYLQRQELDFANILTDTLLVRRMAGDSLRQDDMVKLSSLDVGIYLYRASPGATPELAYWNTQRAIPMDHMLGPSNQEYLAEMPNGQYEFIQRRVVIGAERDWILCGLVPIRSDYFLENDYLRKGFAGAPDVEANYRISTSVKDIPIRSSEGRVVYRIEPRPESSSSGGGWIVIVLRLLGALLICFYLHMVVLGVQRFAGPALSLGFLVVAILVLRILTYLLPSQWVYGGLPIFDPGTFRAGFLSRSLGDLLLNSLLFVWVVLTARSLLGRQRMPKTAGLWRERVRSVSGTLVLVTATWQAGDTVRRLVSDSEISYDVTDFFRMDGYTVVGFFTIVCLSMGYFILSQMLFRWFRDPSPRGRYGDLLLTAAVGLLMLSLFVPSHDRLFCISLLAWLLVYRWLSPGFSPRNESLQAGQGVVGWLVFFAASITGILYTENRSREMLIRQEAAVNLARQTDPAGDYLVDIATSTIGDGLILSNLDRFRNPGLAQRLKDSIVSANFMGFTNRFDTRVLLYDAKGSPFSPSDRISYDTLHTIYSLQASKTGVAGMRYYEEEFGSFGYIYRREVRDGTDSLRAILFMLSSPRPFREEALYPELVRPSGGTMLDRQYGYAYAVYDSLQLTLGRNDYDFPMSLSPQQVPADSFEWRREGGHDVLWHRVDADKVVVIARRSRHLLEGITLFGYIFCASLLLMAVFQLASYIVRSRFDPWVMLRMARGLSIRRQIHGTVILFSLFSFLVIGAVTIFFFIDRYDTGNREMLSRALQSISAELEYRLSPSSVEKPGRGYMDTLQSLVEGISEAHNTDVNVYGPGGDLLASSLPFVYDEGILSRRMNPVAYWNMRHQGKVQYVQTEDYGQLAYLSIYRSIRMPGSRASQAFVNIPYFSSNRGLRQEISGFLVALINLNSFVFLISGVISLLITGRITESLAWMGKRMEELSLIGQNEEIRWDRKDEIGVLVRQYNRMVHKLKASAEALATQEREGAWREMAQQVAHEIKNPLTPMKLSIQRLQLALDRNEPNVREMSVKMAATLIEHIEHLSQIAGDFSEFANIGQAENAHFDLRGVISSVAVLNGMTLGAEISCDLPPEPVQLFADRTQMNRLFTNLVRNALEAVPRERKAVIRLKAVLQGAEVEVQVQDNGEGIPEEARAKIFSPRFTTKSSGTGLGLAMCRSIVEKAHGRISFETVAGEGTVFHVHLPVVGADVAKPGEG
jgi:two-component system nitrogen regulation sensor histidine kinase NtrY